VRKVAEECSCKNKTYNYVCVDTPQGEICTPVDKAPQCFDNKVTFTKVK